MCHKNQKSLDVKHSRKRRRRRTMARNAYAEKRHTLATCHAPILYGKEKEPIKIKLELAIQHLMPNALTCCLQTNYRINFMFYRFFM